MTTLISFEEACTAILDYIKSDDFDRATLPEERSPYMSGLGMACVIINARCKKYRANLPEEETN